MKIISFVLLFSILIPKEKEIYTYKKIIRESKNDSLVINAYTNIMRSLGPNEIDSVMFYGNKALQYSKSKKYWIGELTVNHNISNMLSMHGELTESIPFSERAVKIAQEHNAFKELARSYGLLTVVYGRKGEFAKSTSYVYKSLRIYEKLKDRRGIATSYIKLSAISIQLKDFKNTLLHANKAETINRALKDEELEIDISNNKAVAYAELGRLDEALAMFTRIYEIADKKQGKDISQKALSLMNIGLVYKEKKEYDKAIDFYRRSFKESMDMNLSEGILKNLQNISQAYYLKGDYAASNTEGIIALEKARSMKVIDLEVEILELLKENYTKQEDYKNALKYTHEYYEAVGKLDVKNREREIGRLRDEYQLSKAEEQIKLGNEINETRTHQRNLSIVLLIITFLSMAVFAYAYYRIRLLNKRNVINKDKLAESNYMKDRLFSVIGHDLRSAYSNTLSVLSMMKDKQLDEEEEQLLLTKVIIQSSSALETLDDLLAWGNAQIKGSTVNPVNFNSTAAIQKNLDFLSESISNKQIIIENLIQERLAVFADQDHFNFIMRNLISNAIKFTSNGGMITIGYQTLSNGFYQFFVQDSGVGMSSERLAEIFTKEVASTSGTKNEKGTGLGLVLCREFILLNEGEIFAESQVGEGTTIYFSFRKGEL